MKLLRLVLENFIAYRDRVEIPFEELLQDKLLLISGPTGSGKSTLMDAIIFGLFNKKKKSDRTPVSQFNPDGVARVELEFAIGGQRRWVRRAWKITKEGSLQTIQSDDQDLKKLGERYPFLSAKNDDIFRRVVVIPQGEYNHLIQSAPKKRYELLEKLLPLGNVKTLAEILTTMHKEGENERDTALNRLRTLMERLVEPPLPEAKDPADLKPLLQSVKKNLQEERKKLEEEEKQLNEEKKALDEVRKRLEALKQRLDALESLEKALDKLLELARRREPIEVQRKTLARLKEFLQTFQEPYSRLKRLEKDIPETEEKRKQVQKELEGLKKERSDLEKDLQKLPEMEKEKEQLAREEERLKHQVDTLQKLSDVLKKIEKLRSELDRDREVLDLFHTVHRIHLQRERDRLGKELKNLEDKKDALEKQIRDAHLAHHLAKLVESLEEGKPCPLCGSVHHPQPYAPPPELPSVEQLEKNKRQVEKTLRELQKQLGAVEEQLKQVKPVEGQREDDIPVLARKLGFPEGVEAIHRRLEKEYGDPQTLEKALGEKEKKLKGLEGETETLRKQLEHPVHSLQEIAQQLQETREELDGLRERKKGLEEQIQGLRAREKDLESKIQKAEGQLKEVEEQLRNFKKEKDDLQNRLQDLLQKAQHHRTMEDLARSSEKVKEVRRLEKEVDAWDEAWKKASTRRDEALKRLERTGDLADLRGVIERARTAETPEDLTHALRATRERLASEKNQVQILQQEWSDREEKWNQRFRDLNQQKGELKEQERQIRDAEHILSRWEEQRPRFEALEAIHKKVRNNQFVYWVTRHYLSRMLRHASEYLRAFSRDRYAFVSDILDEQSIPLVVQDSFTGEERDARHLSGGEQFMASLALALGMSRTLVEMQGSDAPGFLFIDEGFGTLDSETLNQVAQVLREHAHREDVDLIVISHRQELRDYFPAVLEVIPSSTGSTVRLA